MLLFQEQAHNTKIDRETAETDKDSEKIHGIYDILQSNTHDNDCLKVCLYVYRRIYHYVL